ncbi:MAG: hypothetical protein NC092_11350, partial [Butyrivibrio sp.]|nr:hypothetical protein [Butyrivibrio sp.]
QNEEGEINMCQAWDEIQEEWREEGRAEGREEGRKEGKAEERKEGIRIFILDNIEEGKSGETIVEKLCRRFSLDVGAAQAYYNTYAASV